MQSSTDFNSPFVLQSSVVESADIDQEVALLQLQGIKVSRRIVRLRLAQDTQLVFQGDPGSIAQPIDVRQLPPREVIERLIEWAIEQSNELSREVLDFLAEPDEDRLTSIIKKLPPPAETPEKRNPGTLSHTLTLYLEKAPRTKEELYSYTRTLHQAARPEAAVRQYLRRAERAGELSLGDDGRYHINR